ncbi:site-2 protease family protein [Thermotoga sp.]|uniref:site-2 protease family protein n=1 Tax=Thermotoga sp. TaxID=28240 RepID=UPI0025E67244|nr:site-2 protease family protein [Thermotoga sp.]MCD6550652.1 site-2 protease family protein [Thermotoga sp.]
MRMVVPTLSNILTGFLAVLIVAMPREYVKGIMAYKLGDPTPKQAGRLSLNPFVHLDPVGTISFILFEFGWSRPVPVRYWKLKNKKKDLLKISILGPLTSFLLFFLCGFTASKLPRESFWWFLMVKAAKYNLTYALFSLFPIPPLDGSRILASLLPDRYMEWLIKYEVYGILFMLALLVLWIIPLVMNPFVTFIDNLVQMIVR